MHGDPAICKGLLGEENSRLVILFKEQPNVVREKCVGKLECMVSLFIPENGIQMDSFYSMAKIGSRPNV